jgi:nitrogen fixation protein FixH
MGCSKQSPTVSLSAWQLELKVEPDHPRMVRPATFTLHISDASGYPIEAAQVTGSLNMTLMDMGKTEVKFERKGHGDYQATVKSFDMSGPWEIAIDAVDGATKAHKRFQFTVLD